MRIGSVHIPSPLVLAPMAGVTDLAFRTICRELGAAYTITEMVSAKALCYQDKKTRRIMELGPEEHPGAIQLFGSDVVCMEEAAAKIMELERPDVIDINMGCPVPKVANSGDGSALMRDPDKAARIVEAVRRGCGIPVTVKNPEGLGQRQCQRGGVLPGAPERRSGGGHPPRPDQNPDVLRQGGLGHHPGGERTSFHPSYRQRRHLRA